MATAREEGGFGAGGKFRKRPFKRTTQATPYDRPPTALRNSANINLNNNNNGWFSKLVDPAQKLIISSAHRLFGSVFRKRLPPPPPPTAQPEAKHGANETNQELLSIDCPGVQGAINGHADAYDTSDKGLSELEEILKKKTFTRSEIDRLTALLHSKTDDMPVGNEQKMPEVIPSKPLVSHDRMGASLSTPVKENGSGNKHILMPAALDEDVASPAELAKAYMGSRPSKVSPSTLGLRSQAFREESTLISSRPFSAASPSMSFVPRSSGHSGVSENGFVTPRSRGRSAIYNMARTPYSRVTSTTTLKGVGSSLDPFAGPSSASLSTLEKKSLTGSKQGTLKRRSSVLDSDIGSVGPIRRIRKKPDLVTAHSLVRRGTGLTDAVQQPSSSMQKPLSSAEPQSITKVLTENKDGSIPVTSFTSVPSKSSEMASKILQQLDKLVSSREKSPMKLSPSMLCGPALKSLENVDSSMLLENVQDNDKSDGSAHTSLPDARDSTSQKRDKMEENGSMKFISSFDKLVPAMNGAVAAGNSRDDVPGIKTADSATANVNSYSFPQKKRAFQMSAHEDYLELDDDDHSTGAVSALLAEGGEKLGASGSESKTDAAEATRVEEPSTLSEVKSPSSLLNSTSDMGTAGGSTVAETSSVFSFPAPSPGMTPQSALVATTTTLNSNKAALPNETNAAPTFNFGGKVASPEEPNDVSPKFNCSSRNVDKIPQFNGVPSSSLVSDPPAVKFGASFDPKRGTSSSSGSVAVGAIGSELIVPESDKADNQSIAEDGVVFRTPETVLPAAASTSASAPSIFSFGTLANGSLASSSSVISSSMSPLASNTSIDQNLFNSSATALSTADSIAVSTTTTSAATPFTAAPIFKFGSPAVVSPISATFGIDSTEPKTKDASFGNSTGNPIADTSAFPSTQSNIFSGTSSAVTGLGSSNFGGISSAVTSTESSITVGVSPPVTSTGGSTFGGTSATTGTGSSIFGFNTGATSAATGQSLFSNPFTAGSAGNGVVTSTQTTPVQFGSSATPSSFGLAGNSGFSSSSSPFGSSISAAKPFSSVPSFGLNSSTSLSEANSISSSSGTTPTIFGSSWQAPKSPSLFGSTFSSTTPSTTFQFGASASSAATNSASVFGSSTGASSSSIFPFSSSAAATSSQLAFGNANPINPFGSAPTNNNDQISMEDSMAEDTVQASTPTVQVFGQQSVVPSTGFVFGLTAPPSPFQFSSQQNLAGPQNSLFQASNSSEFNAGGGSFSLGSGAGDKSQRRILKVKSKQRRK